MRSLPGIVFPCPFKTIFTEAIFFRPQFFPAPGAFAAFFPQSVFFPAFFVYFVAVSFQKPLLTQAIGFSFIVRWHKSITPFFSVTRQVNRFNIS
jgi:hypothetical protein